MARSLQIRVKTLEHAESRGPAVQARLRPPAGDPIPETTIIPEMMEDPVNGEAWREMFEALGRQRLSRQ